MLNKIQQYKKDKSLNTDTGQSWKGIFYLVFPGIMTMPESHWKNGLLFFWGCVMAWVSYLTAGHEAVKPGMEEPENDEIDVTESIQDVLERDRKK